MRPRGLWRRQMKSYLDSFSFPTVLSWKQIRAVIVTSRQIKPLALPQLRREQTCHISVIKKPREYSQRHIQILRLVGSYTSVVRSYRATVRKTLICTTRFDQLKVSISHNAIIMTTRSEERALSLTMDNSHLLSANGYAPSTYYRRILFSLMFWLRNKSVEDNNYLFIVLFSAFNCLFKCQCLFISWFKEKCNLWLCDALRCIQLLLIAFEITRNFAGFFFFYITALRLNVRHEVVLVGVFGRLTAHSSYSVASTYTKHHECFNCA